LSKRYEAERDTVWAGLAGDLGLAVEEGKKRERERERGWAREGEAQGLGEEVFSFYFANCFEIQFETKTKTTPQKCLMFETFEK
jgi:hypothetical protein